MSDDTDALRTCGLRATSPRLAVLGALGLRPHVDADTIAGLVRHNLGTIAPQTVYNVLGALVAAGLVRRIEPAGSSALYERRVGDNHHHIACRSCGAVADVDCAVGRRPCLTPADVHGYVLDEAEVTFWGICPNCQPLVRRPDQAADTSSGPGPGDGGPS